MLLHCYVMGIGVIVGYAIEEVAVAGAVARLVAVDAVVAMAAMMAGAVAVVGAAAAWSRASWTSPIAQVAADILHKDTVATQ